MIKKRILVCEDDEGISEVLTIILKNGGYDVRALNNGKDIRKRIVEFNPDLLLLDIMMPELDGREIAKSLKNEKKFTLPILILTALNNPEQIAREANADGFVSKPFDMNALLSKVEKCINNNVKAEG